MKIMMDLKDQKEMGDQVEGRDKALTEAKDKEVLTEGKGKEAPGVKDKEALGIKEVLGAKDKEEMEKVKMVVVTLEMVCKQCRICLAR